jgi:hypothetical protein
MTMDARLVLAARVDALRQDLAIAATALDNPAIDSRFRQRVAVLFGGLLQRKGRDLDSLAQDLDAWTSHDRSSLAGFWRRFEEQTRDCHRLLREYRAFLEGALLRSARLDHGICDLADALLRQLAHLTDLEWPRFTIVAEDEFFPPMTGIIRVRYTHIGIWNLPVLAHEFGHFAAEHLKDRFRGTDPLRDLRDEVRREVTASTPPASRESLIEQTLYHLDEHIADAFAAYAAGPSFAATCLLLHFEPARAYEDTREHPSDARRTYLLLTLLDLLSAEYVKIRRTLRTIWDDSLSAAGMEAMRDADDWLDRLARRLVDLFDALAPMAKFEVADWRRSVELSQRLGAPGWEPDASAITPRDILNAAWVCRLEHPGETTTIGARALELARRLSADAPTPAPGRT